MSPISQKKNAAKLCKRSPNVNFEDIIPEESDRCPRVFTINAGIRRYFAELPGTFLFCCTFVVQTFWTKVRPGQRLIPNSSWFKIYCC